MLTDWTCAKCQAVDDCMLRLSCHSFTSDDGRTNEQTDQFPPTLSQWNRLADTDVAGHKPHILIHIYKLIVQQMMNDEVGITHTHLHMFLTQHTRITALVHTKISKARKFLTFETLLTVDQ